MKKLCIVLVILTLMIPQTTFAAKKKIAVLDFDDSSIISIGHRSVIKGSTSGIVVESLINDLIKDGTYTVVERSKIREIINEQKFGTSGLVDESQAAKLGKILGVSAVLVGTITQFSVEEDVVGVLGVGVKVNTAKVEISVRLIDTSTAEAILATTGTGEDTKKGIRARGLLEITGGGGFENTILGVATHKATAMIVDDIKKQADKLKDSETFSTIAYYDASKKSAIIEGGKEEGFNKGDRIMVISIVKEIKSAKGEVIKRITADIAELKITEVDKKSVTAICISGNCNKIKDGYLVKLIPSIDQNALVKEPLSEEKNESK